MSMCKSTYWILCLKWVPISDQLHMIKKLRIAKKHNIIGYKWSIPKGLAEINLRRKMFQVSQVRSCWWWYIIRMFWNQHTVLREMCINLPFKKGYRKKKVKDLLKQVWLTALLKSLKYFTEDAPLWCIRCPSVVMWDIYVRPIQKCFAQLKYVNHHLLADFDSCSHSGSWQVSIFTFFCGIKMQQT